MERTLPFKIKIVFVLILTFFSQSGLHAQISAPTFAFTKICASPGFNTYTVNFSFTGSNTYTLEMSDPNGSFSSLTGITILSSQTTTSPGSFTFKVPTSTAGQNYKLRVRGSSPSVIGSSSSAFPAYYQAFDQPFYLNNKASNIGICGSGTVTLSVDATAPSPVSIPNLKYKWFKDGVVISGQTGSSLIVSSTGQYQAFLDYGSCSTFDEGQVEKSQKVTVSVISSSTTFNLSSSIDPPNDVCPSNPTVLSTSPGYSYKWYRNDVEIAGATANTYTTAVTGNYKVLVNAGSCVSPIYTNTIQVNGFDFNLTFPASQSPSINKIQQGETFAVTVTTTATNPTFEWYAPGSTTPVSTSDTFSTDAPIDGDYKLVVKQTSGCVFSKEILFRVGFGINPTQIPNTISPNGDTVNDLWEIPNEYLTTEYEVLIVDTFGKEILKTTNYQNNWPQNTIEFKSVNPIFYYVISKGGSPVKKGTITVIK